MNKDVGVADVSQAYLVEAAERAVPVGYKQTEVGVIPEDWVFSTIGEYTSWMSGGTPNRANEEYWRGTIPWISGSTLKRYLISTSDQFLTESGVASGSKMAPLNSVLLLVRGSALHKEIRAGMVIAPVAFNQDVKALIPLKQLDSKYLTFFILAMENKLLKLVSSAGNSAGVLDTILVKNFTLILPSIKEQTAIANALSDVDVLLSELEKLIAKKQAIKTATMQQLLTGRTRLPQFALRKDGSLKGYKQSELGEVPEDWELDSIGSLVKITTGNKNTQDKLNDGVYPFFVRSQTVEKINSYSFNGEGVLTAGDGVGTGKIFHYIDGKFDFHQRVYLMHNFGEKLDGYFFFIFFSNHFYERIMSMTAKSSVDSVRREMIADMKISLPSKQEQTAIASILSNIDEEIQALEQRLSKTRQIKQGMMQELLTGRTRLLQPSAKVAGQSY